MEYYIRFISVASLLLNARDYGQHSNSMSQTQLQGLFAQTLNKGNWKIDLGKLSQYMSDPNTLERFHPREEASGYSNLWRLVQANERLTETTARRSMAPAPTPKETLPASQALIMAHNTIVEALEDTPQVSHLGKGRSSEAPPLTPDNDLQGMIAKAVEKALSSALAKDSSPLKRQRQNPGQQSQGKRPISEQAAKMDAARDEDQVPWPKLPLKLRNLLLKACGAIREAKQLSSEPHVIEQSTTVTAHLADVQQCLTENVTLLKTMSQAKLCIGCIGYGHLYRTNKCPLA